MERIFSSIKLRKTCLRNRPEIPVVDDLMVVISYYDDTFEPDDVHYDLYRMSRVIVWRGRVWSSPEMVGRNFGRIWSEKKLVGFCLVWNWSGKILVAFGRIWSDLVGSCFAYSFDI